jgi:hypothetical protein
MNMVPLNGEEYLGSYYPKAKQVESMSPAVQKVRVHPLISVDALRDTWDAEWYTREESGLADVNISTSLDLAAATGSTSLTELAMGRSIEQLLDQGDLLQDDVEELPIFASRLRTYLYQHPDTVANRPRGFELLQIALRDAQELDLHLFSKMSSDQVILLAEGAYAHLKLLDVSGNKNLTKDGIKQLL